MSSQCDYESDIEIKKKSFTSVLPRAVLTKYGQQLPLKKLPELKNMTGDDYIILTKPNDFQRMMILPVNKGHILQI